LKLIFDEENTFLGSFDYVCDIENLIASFELTVDKLSISEVVQAA
jgi:hypothetical protein